MENSVTKMFKTKSEIIERKMPKILGNNQYKGKTIIGLDVGYSGVKIASPVRVATIPSYAKKVTGNLEVVGKLDTTDIQYRDNKTGEVWLVGRAAESLMNNKDISSATDGSFYTRYRYSSEIFKVLTNTGICLGLWGTGSGNEIFLETGLPATYKEPKPDGSPSDDEVAFRKSLVGDYDISIRLGNNDWVPFQFTLDNDHIDIMAQPKGALSSVMYKDGELTPQGKDIFRSNSMILDGGFGTEDIYTVLNGIKGLINTYEDTGMRAVFEQVIQTLSRSYPIDTKIFEFQKFLESGQVRYFNQNDFGVYNVDFENILTSVNAELCEKSLIRLIQEYDKMMPYKYLIVDGGTGESRFEQIKKFFEKNTGLTVLPSNLNTPDLSFTYSNVIGYYMFRYAKLVSDIKKAGYSIQ